MNFAAIAGISSVLGSITGAIGASQQAKAQKKAANAGIKDIQNFSKDQIAKSNELGKTKQDYLENGDPFADMGKFIFGDPSQSTYSNLRKAQSDFSALAAGDTSAFSKEVSSIVSSALSNTFGGPKGSFENLSAKNLFNFRQGGVNTALQLTNYFGGAGGQLINNKFGILDQTFERQLKINEYQTNAVNNLRMQAAGAEGVAMAGIGNVFNSIGGAVNSYGAYQQNQQALADQKAYGDRYLGILEKTSGISLSNPSANSARYVNSPTSYTNSPTPLPSNNSNGGNADQYGNPGPPPSDPFSFPSFFLANGNVYPTETMYKNHYANYVNGAPSVLPPKPSY